MTATLGMNGRSPLASAGSGRLDQSCALASSGRFCRPWIDQVIERDIVGDQANDALRRLDRGDTIFGSSTSRRIRLAEATSNWPLTSWISRLPVLQLGQGPAMVGLQALPSRA